MKLLNVNAFDLDKVEFLAHLSMECAVSYCGHSQSVGVRLAVRPSTICLLTL